MTMIACLMRREPASDQIVYSQRVVNPRFEDNPRYREFLITSLFYDIKDLGVDTTTGVWRMETREPLT